jgi:predicted Zn-dependent protease
MLASLANQTTLDARAAGRDARSLPAWASTHPDPASRVQRAAALARQINGTKGGARNAPAFLAALDGVMYGDDPKQGVIEGNEFLHPDMKLRFAVPAGYGMQNGATAVTVAGSGGQAQFAFGPYGGDMTAYIDAVFQGVGGNQRIPYSAVQRTTVNSLPAAYASATVATQHGQQVSITVFAYEFARDRAYHFLAMTPAGQMRSFDPMFASVRRMSDAEARAVRPRRIDVVTVARGDTFASLAGRMAFTTYQTERFQVLNGLTASSTLKPGQKVKLVVYAAR